MVHLHDRFKTDGYQGSSGVGAAAPWGGVTPWRRSVARSVVMIRQMTNAAKAKAMAMASESRQLCRNAWSALLQCPGQGSRIPTRQTAWWPTVRPSPPCSPCRRHGIADRINGFGRTVPQDEKGREQEKACPVKHTANGCRTGRKEGAARKHEPAIHPVGYPACRKLHKKRAYGHGKHQQGHLVLGIAGSAKMDGRKSSSQHRHAANCKHGCKANGRDRPSPPKRDRSRGRRHRQRQRRQANGRMDRVARKTDTNGARLVAISRNVSTREPVPRPMM